MCVCLCVHFHSLSFDLTLTKFPCWKIFNFKYNHALNKQSELWILQRVSEGLETLKEDIKTRHCQHDFDLEKFKRVFFSSFLSRFIRKLMLKLVLTCEAHNFFTSLDILKSIFVFIVFRTCMALSLIRRTCWQNICLLQTSESILTFSAITTDKWHFKSKSLAYCTKSNPTR